MTLAIFDSGINIRPEVKEWHANLPPAAQRMDWDSLSSDQWEAVYAACDPRNNLTLLMGEAGSGKSFVTMFIRKLIASIGKERVITTATTGVAAVRIGADGTLNKVGQLGVGNVLPVDLQDNLGRDRRSRGSLLTCVGRVMRELEARKPYFIIVDEVSMGSSELLYLFTEIFKKATNQKVRFLLVGDFSQLPPVPNLDKSIPYPTHSNWAFQPAQFTPAGGELHQFPSVLDSQKGYKTHMCWLTTQHRQNSEDEWFKGSLNLISGGAEGLGINHPDLASFRKKCCYSLIKDEGTSLRVTRLGGKKEQVLDVSADVHIFFSNKEASAWNSLMLSGKQTKVYRASIKPSGWSEKDVYKYVSWAEPQVELALGLKFMTRVNHPEGLYQNGTVGKIVKLDSSSITILSEGKEILVSAKTEIPLPTSENGNPVASLRMLPGHLAHGLTAHKTQGLTIKERVVIHPTWLSSKTHGWFYVACSRVTRPEDLIVVFRKNLNPIYCDEKVLQFLDKAKGNEVSESKTILEEEPPVVEKKLHKMEESTIMLRGVRQGKAVFHTGRKTYRFTVDGESLKGPEELYKVQGEWKARDCSVDLAPYIAIYQIYLAS